MTKKQIREAVARGWCRHPNTSKTMDVDLAKAITEEVYHAQTSWPIRLRLRLLMPFSCRWNAWVRDATAALERRG